MKRSSLFSLIMAGLLFLAGAGFAAEDDVDDGVTYVERIYEACGFSLLVPEGWEEHDVLSQVTFDAEDMAAVGNMPDLFVAFSDAESGWVINLACWQTNLPDEQDIADMERDFGSEGGWSEFDNMRVFLYRIKQQDTAGAYVFMDDMVLNIGGIPGTEAGYARIVDSMVASLAVVPPGAE